MLFPAYWMGFTLIVWSEVLAALFPPAAYGTVVQFPRAYREHGEN
jgi:hypothetical protein